MYSIKTSVVLFGILEESSENYRKLSMKSLGVLLVKNEDEYSLPEYEDKDSIDLDTQSFKAISDCTGLQDVYVEQLYGFIQRAGRESLVRRVEQRNCRVPELRCDYLLSNLVFASKPT